MPSKYLIAVVVKGIFVGFSFRLLQNHHGLLGNTKDITAPPCAGNVFKRMLSSTQSKRSFTE